MRGVGEGEKFINSIKLYVVGQLLVTRLVSPPKKFISQRAELVQESCQRRDDVEDSLK